MGLILDLGGWCECCPQGLSREVGGDGCVDVGYRFFP